MRHTNEEDEHGSVSPRADGTARTTGNQNDHMVVTTSWAVATKIAKSVEARQVILENQGSNEVASYRTKEAPN